VGEHLKIRVILRFIRARLFIRPRVSALLSHIKLALRDELSIHFMVSLPSMTLSLGVGFDLILVGAAIITVVSIH